MTAKRKFAISIKNDIQNRFDSLNIHKNQSNHDSRIIDKNYAFTKIRESINDTTQKSLKMISNLYKKWIHLFREKKSTKIFFKHKSWNHEIKLKSKKQFTFEFIYVLFKIEFNVFKKYLNTNLKKKFIKKFKSSTKYSIFFTFKKNDKFRLCVDYQKLNDITIKNKYSLFNINEFQNKLQKTKYFIKINLRETYNLIRMKKKMKNNFQNSI